jgi:ribosomal protein L18E
VEERKYPFKDTTAQSKSVEVIKEKARKNENNKRATNYIKMLRNQAVSGDVLTWQQIADQLNEGAIGLQEVNSFNLCRYIEYSSE